MLNAIVHRTNSAYFCVIDIADRPEEEVILIGSATSVYVEQKNKARIFYF